MSILFLNGLLLGPENTFEGLQQGFLNNKKLFKNQENSKKDEESFFRNEAFDLGKNFQAEENINRVLDMYLNDDKKDLIGHYIRNQVEDTFL